MDRKTAMQLMLVSFVVIASLTAVYAKEDEENCVVKPASGVSATSLTQGVSYIMAGGTGPLLVMLIVAIIAMAISHIIWGGF